MNEHLTKEEKAVETPLANVPGVTYRTWKFSNGHYFTFTHTRSGLAIVSLPFTVSAKKPVIALANKILSECNWDIEWPEKPDQELLDTYWRSRERLKDEAKQFKAIR